MNRSNMPLVVDLDGTLIKTDLLLESLYAAVRQNPILVFYVPFWILAGKASLKGQLSKRAHINVKTLPYNEEFLEYLRQRSSQGQTLVLATASVKEYADNIASYLGIFHEVIATDGKTNLKGKNKLKVLLAKYGEKGFDYAGDDLADLHIFPHARHAIVVKPSTAVLNAAKRLPNVEKVFAASHPTLKIYIKAIRAYQWLKNSLLFVPFFASHSWDNQTAITHVILGFISFSLCASGGYVLNDMLDLESDRDHPRKRFRPFACGDVSLWTGSFLMLAMQACGLALAASINLNFAAALVVYCVLSFSYTVHLKTYVLIDVLILAGLYTLRVIAGGLLIERELSFWLIGFSIFIFFSLALVKRCSELFTLSKTDKDHAGARDYGVSDLEYLREMGIASGYMAILIFAFYINSPEMTKLYSHPHILWFAVPVLFYWISRIWLKTGRGEMHDDPIVFSLKDRGSRFVAAAFVLIILLAV